MIKCDEGRVQIMGTGIVIDAELMLLIESWIEARSKVTSQESTEKRLDKMIEEAKKSSRGERDDSRESTADDVMEKIDELLSSIFKKED